MGELLKADENTLLDCDYCGKEMDILEYQNHACDGLRGLNPFQEKMKHCKWMTPDGKVMPSALAAELAANGHCITPAPRPMARLLAWLKGLG